MEHKRSLQKKDRNNYISQAPTRYESSPRQRMWIQQKLQNSGVVLGFFEIVSRNRFRRNQLQALNLRPHTVNCFWIRPYVLSESEEEIGFDPKDQPNRTSSNLDACEQGSAIERERNDDKTGQLHCDQNFLNDDSNSSVATMSMQSTLCVCNFCSNIQNTYANEVHRRDAQILSDKPEF